MHIHKVPLLEKLVDRICDQGAHAEYRLKCIRSGTQVRDGAQVFKAVALFLKRVVRAARALYHNLIRLHLKGLLCAGSRHDGSRHDHRSAHADLCDLCVIIQLIRRIYDLQRLEKCSVIYDQEPEILGVAVISNPAPNGHFLTGKLLFFPE